MGFNSGFKGLSIHATHMRHVAICGMFGSTTFSRIIS